VGGPSARGLLTTFGHRRWLLGPGPDAGWWWRHHAFLGSRDSAYVEHAALDVDWNNGFNCHDSTADPSPNAKADASADACAYAIAHSSADSSSHAFANASPHATANASAHAHAHTDDDFSFDTAAHATCTTTSANAAACTAAFAASRADVRSQLARDDSSNGGARLWVHDV